MASRYGGLINSRFACTYINKYVSTTEQIASRDASVRDFFISIEDMAGMSAYEDNQHPADHIIFGLVDNNMARQAIHEFAQKIHAAGNVYVVDTGNDMYNGQFYVSKYTILSQNIDGLRHDVKRALNDRANSFNNQLLSDTYFDFAPGSKESREDVSVYSCAEADIDEANQDQMLVANDFAASLAHNWLVNYFLCHLGSAPQKLQKHSDFICGGRSVMNTGESIVPDIFAGAVYASTVFAKHIGYLNSDPASIVVDLDEAYEEANVSGNGVIRAALFGDVEFDPSSTSSRINKFLLLNKEQQGKIVDAMIKYADRLSSVEQPDFPIQLMLNTYTIILSDKFALAQDRIMSLKNDQEVLDALANTPLSMAEFAYLTSAFGALCFAKTKFPLAYTKQYSLLALGLRVLKEFVK